MFPRLVLLTCGVFNALAFVLFTFYPAQAVEDCGTDILNLETGTGQVILFLPDGCEAFCLGFTVILLRPLICGASQEVVKLSLISYGVTAAMSVLVTLSQQDETADMQLFLQNLTLATLPLIAYYKVPKGGYSRLHNMRELFSIKWWLCSESDNGITFKWLTIAMLLVAYYTAPDGGYGDQIQHNAEEFLISAGEWLIDLAASFRV